MISIGETLLEFSEPTPWNNDKHCSMYSMRVSLSKKNCNAFTNIDFHIDDNPLNQLLLMADIADNGYTCYWKSACEDFILSKETSDSGEQLVKVNLTVDSEDYDSYWDVNIISVLDNKEIVVNSSKLLDLFLKIT